MTAPKPAVSDSGFARFRASLNKRDRTSIRGMYGFIVFLHLIGFGVLLAFVVPRGYNLGATGIYGIGVGVLAYTFGLRHAFDADHIAAVDNTTRAFLQRGKRPLGIGFFFSLGHSSVVCALATGLAFAASTVKATTPGLQTSASSVGAG